MNQDIKAYSVKQFMTSIKNRLKATPPTWVHGVITQINEKAKVVYISIADFEEGDVKPVATIALSCFSSQYAMLRLKAENAPMPFTLKEQLKVCFLIQADVYIPFGKLQAQILDIDPVYTLGELAVTRSAILKRLAIEGLLDKNKNLELADVPMHVGLVTGENTAAYKDFTTRLAASPFNFCVKTVYAKMQGNDTETSVIAAINALLQDPQIDVICIVRGGGSKTDLNYFDSEALCRAVANSPVPVFTGIGHEIDKSLLDEVAYLSCITPTDCAKRLVERVTDSWNRLTGVAKAIADQTREMLVGHNRKLAQAASQLQYDVSTQLQKEKTKHSLISASLQKDVQFIVKNESARLNRNQEGLYQGSRKILDLAKSQYEVLQARVKSADPQTALAKGFTLTLNQNGKFVRSSKDLKPGDILQTRFRDGNIESVVR